MTGPAKLWEATYRVVITQLWHLRKLLTVGLAQGGQPLHGGAGSEFTAFNAAPVTAELNRFF